MIKGEKFRDWRQCAWQEADYPRLRQELEALAEEDYRAFSQKLVFTPRPILGVRLPWLKALAGEIAPGEYRRYLAGAGDGSHEEILLQAFVIGACRCGAAERLALIAAFVPKIDNWAVCDSFCNCLKGAAKDREGLWAFLQDYLTAPEEMHRRFALVLLLEYYLDEAYLPRVFACYEAVEAQEYYVRMAIAWGLSLCFIKFPSPTLAYLGQCSLDDFTYNKALQKICESRRVDEATKARIKAMKRRGSGGSHGSKA